MTGVLSSLHTHSCWSEFGLLALISQKPHYGNSLSPLSPIHGSASILSSPPYQHIQTVPITNVIGTSSFLMSQHV